MVIANRRNNWRWAVALCLRLALCWSTVAGIETARFNQCDLMGDVDDRLRTVGQAVESEHWFVTETPGGCVAAQIHSLTTWMPWVPRPHATSLFPRLKLAWSSGLAHGAQRSPVKSGIGDRSPPASSHLGAE